MSNRGRPRKALRRPAHGVRYRRLTYGHGQESRSASSKVSLMHSILVAKSLSAQPAPLPGDNASPPRNCPPCGSG